MDINAVANVHNRFDVEVIDCHSGRVKQRAMGENVVLNQAWPIIFSDADWADKIYFGTGTGTIAADRTTLFSPLASKVATDGVYEDHVDENYFSFKQSISILENEHVGATITEVGIGTTTLCTHALLTDMNGNPISILKTATDIIVVYATVYLKQVNVYSYIGGVDFLRYGAAKNPLICQLLGRRLVTTLDGALVYIDGWYVLLSAGRGDNMNDADSYVTPTSLMTFDIPNRRATWYHRIPAASANVNGLKRYTLEAYRFRITQGIRVPIILGRLNNATVTQATTTEQIGVGDGTTKSFKTTFPFVKAGASIYVDGAPVFPTIIYDSFDAKNITGFIRNLTYQQAPDTKFFGVVLPSVASILENPMYALNGVTSVTGSRFVMESSNEALTWSTAVTAGTGLTPNTYSVPAEHQNKRYYRVTRLPTYEDGKLVAMESASLDGIQNVLFSTAPMSGAIITAVYDCDIATKDINHVLDIAVTVQLGEYTP